MKTIVQFKAGDKVKCIFAGYWSGYGLTNGKVYTVESIFSNEGSDFLDPNTYDLNIINDNSQLFGYAASRFVVVEHAPMTLQSVLENLPSLEQRQDTTNEQLADLYIVANKLGMYNAADFIAHTLENIERKDN